PELHAFADTDRRHDRPVDRSHRLRDQEPRGVHEEARSPRHQTGSSLYQGASAWHCDRVYQRSVGDEYRNDGRTRRRQVVTKMRTAVHAVAALLSCAGQPAFAQLVSHPEAPVRVGHYHLNVTSIEAHKKFWADTLGGKATKFGGIDVIEFPDALLFLRVQKPTGPTRGTAFDHIGFAVPNVP